MKELPKDYSRCGGYFGVVDEETCACKYSPCPQKYQCLRYLSRMSVDQYTSWILAPPVAGGKCCTYMIPVDLEEEGPETILENDTGEQP